jgi:hypothetical protein
MAWEKVDGGERVEHIEENVGEAEPQMLGRNPLLPVAAI